MDAVAAGIGTDEHEDVAGAFGFRAGELCDGSDADAHRVDERVRGVTFFKDDLASDRRAWAGSGGAPPARGTGTRRTCRTARGCAAAPRACGAASPCGTGTRRTCGSGRACGTATGRTCGTRGVSGTRGRWGRHGPGTVPVPRGGRPHPRGNAAVLPLLSRASRYSPHDPLSLSAAVPLPPAGTPSSSATRAVDVFADVSSVQWAFTLAATP